MNMIMIKQHFNGHTQKTEHYEMSIVKMVEVHFFCIQHWFKIILQIKSFPLQNK